MLIDWKLEIKSAIVASVLSYGLYCLFISRTEEMFISIDEVRNGIWLAIIVGAGKLIIKYILKISKVKVARQNEVTKSYMCRIYSELKGKYGGLIKTSDDGLRRLTYAVMIYENFNRPYIIRLLEYVKLMLCGHATLGIMQTYTTKFISSNESVIIGSAMIERYYDETGHSLDDMKRYGEVLHRYNPSDNYKKEVLAINLYLVDIDNESEQYKQPKS